MLNLEDEVEVMGIIMIRRSCANSKCPLDFLVAKSDTKTTHHSSLCKQNDLKIVKDKTSWNVNLLQKKKKAPAKRR